MIPRLTIGGGELVAIPAVHNRSVFAEQVNRACRDEATRPEAIAVELSHAAVNAVVAWMKELGVGGGQISRIPCMLGLIKTNRRIHPRYKDAALRLQELHGAPLHQIPADILRKELNYSAVSLLCISATDSIIEAIRSAVELDIPVFGVDLGEIANTDHEPAMIQDPIMAQTSLTSYVNHNEEICDRHRDNVIDDRRELVMVAQLNRLLQQYRRVLFTGGLGHWLQLRRRLLDDQLAPAINRLGPDHEQFTRVVVAPALAIFQMDLLPEFTVHYEAIRQLPISSPQRMMDYADWFRRKFAAVYENAEPKSREGSATFLKYLTNLCLVQPCHVPDLFMTLSAAEAMTSPAFGKHLSRALIREALDWAKPEQWPGLPYINGVPHNREESGLDRVGQRGELRSSGRHSQPFYLAHMSQSESSQYCQLPPWALVENDSARNQHGNSFGMSWVWPPCESLIFGIAYEAAGRINRKKRSRCAEPFTGSLHNGVHLKATLRAFIRGEKQIQVKADRMLPSEASSQNREEPTVFIFEREEAVKDGRWDSFLAGGVSDIRQHIRDHTRFNQVISQQGSAFIASVHFCTDREPRPELRPHVSDLRFFYGVVIFGQPTLNPLQSARWLEESQYAACPILHYSGIRNLFEFYQQKHNLALDLEHWPVSLIRLAMPYAKKGVTIIAPGNFTIPATVIREAGQRNVSLNRLPLSDFTPEHINAIRHQYLVRPIDADALEYSQELQAAFGESPRKHLELLPERIRAQLQLRT